MLCIKWNRTLDKLRTASNTRSPSVDCVSHRSVLSVTIIHRKIAIKKWKLCDPRPFPPFVPQSLRWSNHRWILFQFLWSFWLNSDFSCIFNTKPILLLPQQQQMEEDVTPAQTKCQAFHAKPVEIPPLVLTKVKLFRSPGSRAGGTHLSSSIPDTTRAWVCDLPFCCVL